MNKSDATALTPKSSGSTPPAASPPSAPRLAPRLRRWRDAIYWACVVVFLVSDLVLKFDKGGRHPTAFGISGYFAVGAVIWLCWRKWRQAESDRATGAKPTASRTTVRQVNAQPAPPRRTHPAPVPAPAPRPIPVNAPPPRTAAQNAFQNTHGATALNAARNTGQNI